jgi:DNA modification methylase
VEVNQILVGDAALLSQAVPTGVADCLITSPPYFGHRKYGNDSTAEIGREASVEEYVDRLSKTLGLAGEVVHPDGSMWLNLGDTYRQGRLCGVPWRVVLALESYGWYVRSDVIWHKPNAMPSSVKRRPTTDHEYLFLLARTSSYHYDADAIREPHVTFSPNSKMRGGRNHFGRAGGTPEIGKNSGNTNLHDGRWDQAFHPMGRNKRTVWSVPLGKFREAHFAVFPEKLIEPCVRASSKSDGIVFDPFMGAGTTAVVAQRLGRRYLGFELVAEYAEMARKRISESTKADIISDDQLPLE